jgi:hypothetical protein
MDSQMGSTFNSSFKGVRSQRGGTDPNGRPQPGAGNAGDGDRPRKSPEGPRTANQKKTVGEQASAAKQGKRPAKQKLTSGRGRQAARRGQASGDGENRRASKKLPRKKKNDQGGKKERRAA